MQAIQLEDFLQYRFLSQLRYAPDGQRAAFVVSQCNEEENSYEGRLWLYDGALRQLTDLGREKSYIWQDATHLLFPAVRSVKEKKLAEQKIPFTAYYRLDVTGGEALPAFTLPFAAQAIKALGEGRYAVLGQINANNPDDYLDDAQKRGETAKALEKEKDYEVFDESPFWSNGDGVINKTRSALFLVKENPFQVTRITEPAFDTAAFEVLGDFVYYLGGAYSAKAPVFGGALYRLDVKTGETACIAQYPQLYLRGLHAVGGALWLLAHTGERHGLNENNWVYRVDPQTGALTVLRREEYGMYGSVGSDCRLGGGVPYQEKDGALYHITTRGGSAHLYRLDSDGQSVPVIDKPGSIDAFAVSENAQEALLIALYDGRLQELYRADLQTGAVDRISGFNDAVLSGKYVAPCQALSCQSAGMQIEGWVLPPKDFDPQKRYPAVLDIHGGPKTVYGPVFYHEMQVWASMGYFVFFCNPKGGDGHGNDFADIRGHYGQTDYQNLMDFTDAVLAAYPQIDPKRVCVTGGSYGGFMTNWIIGHTDRFCCAATQRSISNWISFCGVSDIGPYFGTDQCAGDLDTEAGIQKLWEQSPLRYAAFVKTPTLFIHSDEDYRCPLEQGLQLYNALVQHGVPARMCLFHGENHELSRSGKPQHRLRRLREITQWFEKYSK